MRNLQSVEGQRYVIGKFFFHICVEAEPVADMGKISVAGADGFHHLQCLAEVEVRDVLFALKRIQDECFGAFQLFDCFRRDEVRVSDVAEISDTESQHRQPEMHHGQRQKGDAIDLEGLAINGIQLQPGDAGIIFLCEGVSVLDPQLFQYIVCAVDRNFHFLHEVVGAHIVESCRMVAVGMGKNNRVDAPDLFPQHLLSEVGARVDYEMVFAGFDEDRGTQPLIAKI